MLIVIDKNSFSLPNSQEKNWNCYFTGFYYWTELFYDYCQGISINILVSEFCLSMNSFMLPPEKFFPVNLFLILTFNRFSFLANRFRRLFSRLLGIIFLWGCFVLGEPRQGSSCLTIPSKAFQTFLFLRQTVPPVWKWSSFTLNAFLYF